MSIADELVQRALSLPTAERAAIAHLLLVSLENESNSAPDSDSIEAGWEAMLNERLAAADAGDFYPGTIDDLFNEIRQSIASRYPS
jgi:hypothetical protein